MNINELLFLITLLFVNSLVIIGWNKATHYDVDDNGNVVADSKMILWKPRYIASKHISQFWMKPLFTCPTCCASFHSIYIYWAIQPFTIHSLIIYPIYILSLAGLVTIVNNYA